MRTVGLAAAVVSSTVIVLAASDGSAQSIARVAIVMAAMVLHAFGWKLWLERTDVSRPSEARTTAPRALHPFAVARVRLASPPELPVPQLARRPFAQCRVHRAMA